ncbi:MAG: leucyl aminopeptidase family protein [Alphaproteobacteria bacterium]|nr:leucyl aminopeptidase family protein [Alphaproteobacteria bacterium]
MSDVPSPNFKPFAKSKKKRNIPVQIVQESKFPDWLAKQDKALQALCAERGFKAKSGKGLVHVDKDGKAQRIYFGINDSVSYTDGALICEFIEGYFSEELLETISFSFEVKSPCKISEPIFERLYIGFGLCCYSFTKYKKKKATTKPKLVLDKDFKINTKRIETIVSSICLVRDLVNIPANEMHPQALEKVAKALADEHKAVFKSVVDNDLIKKNFPLIYTVGKASENRPRLIEINWGKKTHPKITLVGKGVCFDTGGLDIKPSQLMLTMKKDMGGAAHVLALAHLIIALKLPVNLQVLVPAVENSISGNAFRSSDILKSRKGLTIEVGNTDAEGRLILADALTYACEGKPEIIIDYATLTGSARIAVGYDLPALFSNRDETLDEVRNISKMAGDPVWPLPLWQPYKKDLDSSIADISSTGGKAGASTAALFMQSFIDNAIEWIHMDVYAWEQNGKPGRPKGGADTGLLAIFAFLEKRYGQKQ